MCRLQVIRKNKNSILSDTSEDSTSLKKVSINNIPYYLTIEQLENRLKYEFKFIDSPDCEEISLENNIKVILGNRTGRLYTIEATTDLLNLDIKMLDDIMRGLEKKIDITQLPDLKNFFKAIQEYNRNIV